MTNFQSWVNNFGGRHILRMLEIRRLGQYTPYEKDQRFEDQSLYVQDEYKFIQINEVIELPDEDVLIGFREIYDYEDLTEEWSESVIYYKKLSEIELAYFPNDDNPDKWE